MVRQVNFSNEAQNRAAGTISASLYERKGEQTHLVLSIVQSTLTDPSSLTATSPRLHDLSSPHLLPQQPSIPRRKQPQDPRSPLRRWRPRAPHPHPPRGAQEPGHLDATEVTKGSPANVEVDDSIPMRRTPLHPRRRQCQGEGRRSRHHAHPRQGPRELPLLLRCPQAGEEEATRGASSYRWRGTEQPAGSQRCCFTA